MIKRPRKINCLAVFGATGKIMKRIFGNWFIVCLLVLTACENQSQKQIKGVERKLPVIIGQAEKMKGNVATESELENLKNLILSAQKGKSEDVEKFIKTGANLNAPFRWEKTALMEAAWAGNTDIVKMLIDAGADVNKRSTTTKGDALYGAALEGHTDIVKILVDAKADVNTITQSQNTALWGAAYRGHIDIVKILLDAGADVNKKSIHDSALSAACRSKSADIVALLLERGADPNLRDKYGSTALHYVEDVSVAMALLAAGAEINKADKNGKTVLATVVQKGHDDVAELLRNAGAK